MKLIGACLILLVVAGTRQLRGQAILIKTLTANQIISQMKSHLNCQWSQETVDTFKSGNPDDVVTGVAVCMFANMETLQKTWA